MLIDEVRDPRVCSRRCRPRAALELLEPNETAQTFLTRTLAEKISTGVGILDRRSPLRPTSVLEISGLAGSGKTELLYSVSGA